MPRKKKSKRRTIKKDPYRRIKCSAWEHCNAPICPLDKQSIENSLWYSDEDICRRKDQQENIVIKNQKEIKKMNLSGFFTYDMLNRELDLDKIESGMDPDNKRSINRWIKQHTKT